MATDPAGNYWLPPMSAASPQRVPPQIREQHQLQQVAALQGHCQPEQPGIYAQPTQFAPIEPSHHYHHHYPQQQQQQSGAYGWSPTARNVPFATQHGSSRPSYDPPRPFPAVEVRIYQSPSRSRGTAGAAPMSPVRSKTKTRPSQKAAPVAATAPVGAPTLPARGGEHAIPAPDPSIDTQCLLLSLADEYLDAARLGDTPLAASSDDGAQTEYYQMIAMGLACLEAVLKSRKLAPRAEALVRLRYALILYEETDNDFEAESALTKGISLCETNQLRGLKFAMQHLLARVLFKSNQKAALKALDGMIREVEAYRYTAWEYAFGFLRASLALSTASRQEHANALTTLQRIAAAATLRGDAVIAAVAHVFAAHAQVQISSAPETVEQAQQHIAQARAALQADPHAQADAQALPQVRSMLELVDLLTSVMAVDSAQASAKLPVLQRTMDENLQHPQWRRDGSMSLPVPSAGGAASPTDSEVNATGFIVGAGIGTQSASHDGGDDGSNGNDGGGSAFLTMSWLTKHDLYAISYYISAVVLSGRTERDAAKADKFLREGLALIADSMASPPSLREPLPHASARLQWKQCLRCNMLIQMVLNACARGDFAGAAEHMRSLDAVVEQVADGGSVDEVTIAMVAYCRAILLQSTGQIEQALAAYQHPLLSLQARASGRADHQSEVQRDVAILSTLNTALLQYDPCPSSSSSSPAACPAAAATTLSRVEPLCQSPHASPRVKAAYHVVCAMLRHRDPGVSTAQTKGDLHLAVTLAQRTNNAQVAYLAVAFLAWKFFRGVLGPHAERNTLLARAMAKTADHPMWRSVTEELVAESLERHGRLSEAAAARERADALLTRLPEGLRQANANAA